ncbi:MAG: cyclopropane-fatty-acyl-phospholipid synthase family protein [Planctomycetota bacterium]
MNRPHRRSKNQSNQSHLESSSLPPQSAIESKRRGVSDNQSHENNDRPGLLGSLVSRLFRWCGDPPVAIEMGNGQRFSSNCQSIQTTIWIKDYATLFKVVSDPLFQFGECYSNGTLNIVQGDLEELMVTVFKSMNNRSPRSRLQRIWDFVRRPRRNTVRESKDNIHQHYDIGNDFYKLWLDEKLVYTCAYFKQPDDSLEQAQVSKLDHVCKKLQLRPGMSVVEAGCGWGALAMHMAKHYGVRVKAFNISKEQITYARAAAEQEGLNDKIEFVLDDWRNIRGSFDAFASVGMLEHVGCDNFELLGRTIQRCLKPQGLGLIHSIGQNQSVPLNSWIERRIFPGAYPPTLAEMMRIFEPQKFQVVDVENLRLHYAETLRHWRQRFEAVTDVVTEQYDESFVRMWQMYLAGSIAAFESGYLQLFQVVFAAGDSNAVPWTRAHLYDDSNVQANEPIQTPTQ